MKRIGHELHKTNLFVGKTVYDPALVGIYLSQLYELGHAEEIIPLRKLADVRRAFLAEYIAAQLLQILRPCAEAPLLLFNKPAAKAIVEHRFKNSHVSASIQNEFISVYAFRAHAGIRIRRMNIRLDVFRIPHVPLTVILSQITANVSPLCVKKPHK